MSDHSTYLRVSGVYVHEKCYLGTPCLCGAWKVPAWSKCDDSCSERAVLGIRSNLRPLGTSTPPPNCVGRRRKILPPCRRGSARVFIHRARHASIRDDQLPS